MEMADKNDKTLLSPEAKKKFIEHLNSKTPNMICPMCQQRKFVVADHLTASPIIAPGGVVHLGGTNYPYATIVCQNCYHSLQFAAVPVGLLDEKPEEGSDNG